MIIIINRFLLSEYEILNLDYKYALKIDNRTLSDSYLALLKEKNKLLSIFNEYDYNIFHTKMILYTFNFNLSLTINALFYNDETIHKINQKEGSYDIKDQISIVLYSTLISTAINFIMEYMSLTRKSIISLREKKSIQEVEDIIPEIISKVKCKNKLCLFIMLIFNIFFVYYIIIFCSIYPNIQNHMISDTLMSFSISFSYSITLPLIISIMRVLSLRK